MAENVPSLFSLGMKGGRGSKGILRPRFCRVGDRTSMRLFMCGCRQKASCAFGGAAFKNWSAIYNLRVRGGCNHDRKAHNDLSVSDRSEGPEMSTPTVNSFIPRRDGNEYTASICLTCCGTVLPTALHRNLRAAEEAHICKDSPVSRQFENLPSATRREF